MRLPAASHTARPWRIHALSPDRDRDAPSLRERVPADLRAAPAPAPGPAAFTPLYELPDEWAGELVNRTMHGVLHLGWVSDGAGGHRGQMAVLVRPEGRLGALYMAAIRPFRHRLVYPGLLRTIERRWREGASAPR